VPRLTPLAVIDRYLDAAAREPLDLEPLLALLGTDADLLGRWLLLLGGPAEPAALASRFAALAPSQLRELVVGQALAVLTMSGGTRMGFERWQSALTASFLAEVLAEQHALANPVAVRWRVLLGLAGVHLPADPQLEDLLAFRGTRLELLEDAELLQRLFAIADALDVLEPGSAQQAAGLLLELDPLAFQDALRAAQARTLAAVRELDLEHDHDHDRGDRLWLRLRIGLLGRLFADLPEPGATGSGGSARPALGELHAGISRMLFATAPKLLVLDGAARQLLGVDGAGPRISLDSGTSLVARSARLGERIEFYDQLDAAVADRQLLRELGVDAAVCIPLCAEPAAPVFGVLLFPLDEEDGEQDELGMVLYARELARRLAAGQRGAEAGRVALQQFRSREEQRLRELVHEVNNPLSIVQNYLHILQLTLTSEPKAVEQLGLITGELRRITDLIAQIRQVPELVESAPAAQTRASEIALDGLVRRVVEMHRGYAGSREAALSAVLPATPVRIRSDEARIAQILTNLVRNALEASQGHSVQLEVLPGAYRDGRAGVLLTVADTGPGLPTEVLERLGAPQRTTKGGEHAGLGLHIVHRLVGELCGSLDVRSAAGQGTTFSVFLPLVPSP